MAALTGAALALAGIPAGTALAAPTLPDSGQDAAILCFYSAVVTGRGQTQPMAEAMWFLFDAAREATTDAPATFVDKVEALVGAPPPNLETLSTDAPAMLPQCAARYPLISSKRAVTLPTDPFTRDVRCAALAGYLADMAQAELEDAGESPFGKRVTTLSDRLATKLTPDRFAAAGHADQAAVQALFAVSLRDVSPMGNLISILSACEAAAG
jgi:hypothetical protein